jgi:hypothetical protein
MFWDISSLDKLNSTIDKNILKIRMYIENLDEELFDSLQWMSAGYLPTLRDSSFPYVDLIEAIENREGYIRELESKNRQLEEKNIELKRLMEKNRAMVDDFIHASINNIKPNDLYKVAQALKDRRRYEPLCSISFESCGELGKRNLCCWVIRCKFTAVQRIHYCCGLGFTGKGDF